MRLCLLMGTTPNPYERDLDGRDPFEALDETARRIHDAVASWTAADFERSYAPGKWSIRKVIIHLAQTELALGTRMRFALAEPGYVAQPFSQDAWLPLDEGLDAAAALDAYAVLRRMNLSLLRALPAGHLDREFSHPEYGMLTVRWVVSQMAGHDLHHFCQIQTVAAPCKTSADPENPVAD